MADYTFLKQHDGQWLKVLVDVDGIIQASPNADDSDLAPIVVGDATNAVHADTADLATLADTATTATTASGPANAATFTAALNPATSSLPGLMPADSVVKLADLDYDGWIKGVVDTMHVAAPALTNFREVSFFNGPLNTPVAAPGVADGLAPGGAVTTVGSNKTASLTGYATFQNPATLSWAFAMRAKLITSTGGEFNFIGLINAAGTHDYGIATYSTADATKYVLYTYDGQEVFAVSTLACDDAYHTFVVTFDGTTLKLFIDGTQRASTATLTGISDEAVYLALSSVAGGKSFAARAAIGYIAP